MQHRAPWLLSVLLLVVACRAPDRDAADSDVESPPDAPASCADAPPPTDDFCNATDPRTVPIEVVATPEAGEAPYVSVLSQAEATIDVSIYLMGSGGILDELKDKAGDGVAVRVIFDEGKRSTNQPYADQLVAAGAQIKWSSDEFRYFHAKYFIVDGATAVMSTGNYSTYWSIERERNFVATDSDPADIADLVTLFEADWNGTTPDLSCTRMVVSPINARERILAVIESADTTLDIESMQFADYEVREAVRQRALDGVAVRVLLADADWIDTNADAAAYLTNIGVPVRWIPHNHTKVIVADGDVAYVGSENLSQTSLDYNREVGVVLVEPSSITPLTSTFTGDWAMGVPF